MSDDLATAVRAKVRRKYGEDAAPKVEKPPKILGVAVVSKDAVQGLPIGLIKRVYRLARVDADTDRFVVELNINGCVVNVDCTVALARYSMDKGKAMNQLLREMLSRSALAIREVIDKALVQDMTRYIEDGNAEWLDIDWEGNE